MPALHLYGSFGWLRPFSLLTRLSHINIKFPENLDPQDHFQSEPCAETFPKPSRAKDLFSGFVVSIDLALACVDIDLRAGGAPAPTWAFLVCQVCLAFYILELFCGCSSVPFSGPCCKTWKQRQAANAKEFNKGPLARFALFGTSSRLWEKKSSL